MNHENFRRLLLLFLLLHASRVLLSQFQIEGTITDSINGERLMGVNLISSSNSVIITTDSSGHFSFTSKQQDIDFCASLFGYKKKCFAFHLIQNRKLNIQLWPEVIQGKEIVIVHEQSNRTKNIEMGTVELSMKNIETLPSIGGEKDVLRMLQLTPGVSKSESSLGINVRGGASDQTLILLDGATIYNPSHLMGFFSVFNPMSVDKLKLMKAGIPANYGGRLSSVLEVETKNGISEKTEGEGNIGFYASSGRISVPVIKDKFGITISARKTYFDELIKPVTRVAVPTSIFNDLGYGFYDINAGAVCQFSPKDKLHFNFYKGKDNFALQIKRLDVKNSMDWANDAMSLTWFHIANRSYSSKQSLIYSDYDFHFSLSQEELDFNLVSKIRNWEYDSEYDFFLENQNIKTGAQILYLRAEPNISQATINDLKADFGTPNVFNTALATIFFNDEIRLNSRLLLSVGLRYGYYLHLGSYKEFVRDGTGQITDTLSYGPKDVVARFSLPEPRISLRFQSDDKSSFKFTFNRNYQTLQQVNVSALTMPSDFWIPATKLLKPQSGYQLSVGYFREFSDKVFEFSVEPYYRHMRNLVEFKNGILNILTKATTEENLLTGNGWCYGTEFYLKKNAGKTTGWISYTLSKTLRQFDEINQGKPFPAKYDQTHNLSVVINHRLNESWTVAAIFVYATGNAFTLPVGRYMIQKNIVNEYGAYNSFRMPAYHRLDISATKKLKTGKFDSSVEFSIVNVYNRQNPVYMFIETTGNLSNYSLNVNSREISILPVLPSVNWIIKF